MERRPDHWEFRRKIVAGPHELVIAFPHQYEGLPTIFVGLNPSSKPYDPCKPPGGGCLAAALKMPEETIPEKIEYRRKAIEIAKERASRPPTFPGMSVHEVDITGPFEFKEGPSPESLRKVYTCGHLDSHHQPSCQRKIISSLANRAFRRSVSPEEVDHLVAISSGDQKRGSSFEDGLSLAIATMLVSPDFLFRIEKGSDSGVAGQYALASRLSYFLWSSITDEELLRAAERDTLRKPEVLDAQVRGMLNDPKAKALTENFAGQWLEIRRLESSQPDRDRFPDFDEYLRASVLKETQLFVQYVMQEDRSILDFIDGRYSFLNECLVRHYGIRGITGTEVPQGGPGRDRPRRNPNPSECSRRFVVWEPHLAGTARQVDSG